MIMIMIVLSIVFAILLTTAPLVQLALAWPAGTTEAIEDKILSATSELDLTSEELSMGEDRMYEFFDAYDPDSKEYKELMDYGFVEKYGFEILQCLEDKGHPVR
jgi:hypothetical protein